MSEYSSLINSYANAAPTQAATSAEDSPDDAARSLELSQATGVPAPAIFGDLDQFEAKHKSMLAANIVANNPKLREYVNSHPLAASVSNDDWGNLDAFSQAAQQTNRIFSTLQSKNPAEGAFGGAIQGFQEGFGPGGFSPEVARRTNPATAPGGWLGAQAGLLTYGIGELALRTMSGVMGAASGAARGAGTAVGGERFGREAGALTEYEMYKGEGRPPGMHWIENGREPPRGIDPQIDAAKAQINAQALERLDEDLAAAQASSTKERSPEMFRRFVDQHYGNSTISISGDAAAALYGDKPPTPGDGLLGFVPGMADQLALARTTGADVHIPVADWVANVDPAVAKGLHDDLRVWPGGITAREAKETVEPKVIVDSPLAQERGAYELEPMFSMGDRKLQLSKSGEPLGPGAMDDERIDHYQILDDKGQPVGQMRIGRGDDRELLVDWVGGQAGLWSNSFGPSLIRDLLRQVKALYPDYDYLTGYSISGARDVAGAPDELRVPKVRLDAPEGWGKIETKNEFQDARDIFNAAYWQDFGRGIKGGLGPLTLDQQMLADRIGTELDRMSGGRLNFKAVTGITRQKGGLPQGVYLHDQHNPLTLINMFGPDPLGSGRHELAHFLKNSGLLTPEEWDTLTTAANQEGWHERYNIDERYPGASASLRDEEAVVSAFQEWNKAGRPVGSNAAGIFQKIWELFDRLRQKLFGKDSTWEDIFQKMKSGEVGQRPLPGGEAPTQFEPRFSIDDMDQLRANGVGLDLQSFRRIQEAVRRRYEADLEAATNRAQREQSKTQTKEWKSNQADIRRDVEATIRQRPDVASDLFIGSGELYGQKLRQRYTLCESDLSPEQKAALPEHYVSKNGLPPDEVARLFGYGSGDQMVEGLAGYNAIKGTLSPQKALEKIVDAETERQMQAKYGNLGVNIVDEARDQALSETDQDLIAEELQAWAMQTGQKVVDKAAVQAAARDAFAKMPLGSVSSQSMMNNVAKFRREAIQLLSTQDPAALVSMQRAQFSMALAAEARKLEKAQASFDKLAKQMSKRVVDSMDPEYTNYVHDILMRIGKPVRRSIQDLQSAMGAAPTKGLENFVLTKSAALRELPVWDQLYDPSWRKNYDDLTVDEFRAVSDSVKALVHNGRDELKIEKAGEAADLAIIKTLMIDQLQKFPQLTYDTKGQRWGLKLPRTALAAHLQLENIFNRWDEFDPNGVWNQYGIRDLISGSNEEDAVKKEFAKRVKDTDDGLDMSKTVSNTIFRQPGGGPLFQFNRGNLRAVMLNLGNDSNAVKLAKGYGLTTDVVRAWVDQHATKEDWDWVQKIWDIFKDLKGRSDTMYRSLTGGVAPENIRVRPVDTAFGQYAGGYYPVIWHPEFEGASKKLMGKDPLEQDNYVRATTPAGYTKSRSGYVAPIALDIDQLPNRIGQEIHDITMRPAVINASKIFYDKDIRQAIFNHYGSEYRDLLIPYLRDVANVQNFMSKAQSDFNSWSGFWRQNLITTLVGLNPGTVMKHLPTAAGLSIKEVGPARFLDAVKSLFSINDATGESNYQFAMRNSQELQRRDRNWQETLYGATGEMLPGSKASTLRQRIMELSSKPVALSDKMSAVPTWLAAYRQAMEEGGTHGDGIYAGDRAVRRAHGSTAITNRPAIMRDANPWFTSVYNFFNDVMNRQVETLWKAGKTMDLVKDGDHKAAMAMGGSVAAGLMAYVIWPAMVEQWVSPINEDPKASWAKKAALGLGYTLSSSWIIVRDVVNGLMQGKDPSVGLFSTALKEFSDLGRDLDKKGPMAKEHAGKVIKDGLSLTGLLTGMVPGQVGKTAEFGHDVATGVAHPRGPWGWLVGLRYGTLKKHSSTFDNYLQGKAQ